MIFKIKRDGILSLKHLFREVFMKIIKIMTKITKKASSRSAKNSKA